MTDSTQIHAGHPLFRELRNGLLWHRTSAEYYRCIHNEGLIKLNDGRIDRWGKPYACQELGGISLFDFTTEPEDKVLDQAIKWQQFLGDFDPVTVLLGIDRTRLTGKLIPYPQNKDGTRGNVIPWVEVCHCGSIPLTAIVSHILVCPVDYGRFKKLERLDEPTFSLAEEEFGKVVRVEREKRNTLFSDRLEALRRVAATKDGSARH